MIIHDISKDILTSPVYHDDPETNIKWIKSIENGDEYNLSYISMTAHAGTHIDAPKHFWRTESQLRNCVLTLFSESVPLLQSREF